jgi:SOS-response transcriptional repressor LexA
MLRPSPIAGRVLEPVSLAPRTIVMARRKNLPEAVQTKASLSERLRSVRAELFGERGGPELARRLGIPIRTWYNYESGVTVPGEVILRFVELTGVDPIWLLHGEGPRFRSAPPPVKSFGSEHSVEALLSRALQRLARKQDVRDEQAASPPPSQDTEGHTAAVPPGTGEIVLVGVDASGPSSAAQVTGPRYVAAQREWLSDPSNCRCVRTSGDAMAPIVADGAFVTFTETKDDPEALNGKLVVAWVEGRPLVRWFQHAGQFALLRAENPAFEPNILPIDLKHPPKGFRFHRVLGISTPHY